MVDVCSDANGENDVNMSGGVLVDVCSDVNGENDVNMSGGVAVGVCVMMSTSERTGARMKVYRLICVVMYVMLTLKMT